jgi:hypothetical protein
MKEKRMELVLSREEQWLYARDIVLGALALAGLDVFMDGDFPHFHRMRTDLWSPQQQDTFARRLGERLDARPVRERMFAPYMSVNVVITEVEGFLRDKGLFASV